MPELLLDKDGFLVDADGNQIKIGDAQEPIKVTNAQTKEQVTKTIEERLARQQEKIAALEKQANKTPELEKLLDDLRKEKTTLEEQAARAKQQAEEEVSAQMAELAKKAEQATAALKSEQAARIRDQVTNTILAKAGDQFINPADDIVPKLLTVHKREPAKDADGKTVEGQFSDTFRIRFKNDKGEEVEEALPVQKALEVLASDERYQHYVRSTSSGGSGGSGKTYTGGNLNRSKMNDKDKSDFVSKHGLEAYQNLPE